MLIQNKRGSCNSVNIIQDKVSNKVPQKQKKKPSKPVSVGLKPIGTILFTIVIMLIQNKRVGSNSVNIIQDKVSNKVPQKQKNKPSKTVIANQPHVDRHQYHYNVGGQRQQLRSMVHLNTDKVILGHRNQTLL
jgi:hypothetical protein